MVYDFGSRRFAYLVYKLDVRLWDFDYAELLAVGN